MIPRELNVTFCVLTLNMLFKVTDRGKKSRFFVFKKGMQSLMETVAHNRKKTASYL